MFLNLGTDVAFGFVNLVRLLLKLNLRIDINLSWQV